MAKSSRFSIQGTISMIDGVTRPMKKVEKSTIGFSDKMQKQFKKASRSSLSFGNVVKGILGANIIQGLAYRIKDLAMSAIELASDLTEVQNVVDTTFGKMSNSVNKFADEALEKFGLSELQAKKFAGTFGALIKSSGITGDQLLKMSTGLTGLTGDFASFYNLDHDVAFQKIRAGISGETEPLKQLGINLSVANLQAFALTKGITRSWKSMSQAEQVMLRYNFLLDKSKDAQGDFAKTLETSYANQERIAKTRFNQILAKAATQVLPILIDGFKELNKTLKQIDPVSLGNKIKFFIQTLMFVGKTIMFLLPLIKLIVVGWIVWRLHLLRLAIMQKIAAASTFLMAKATTAGAIGLKLITVATWLLNAAMAILTSPITLVVLAIGALIAVGVLLYKNWDLIKEKAGQAWDWIVQKVVGSVNMIKKVFFSFIYAGTFIWFKLINAILTGAEKVGSALGLNVQKIRDIKTEIGTIQADIQGRSNFASPNSQTITNNNNTTNRLDINVSADKGSTADTKFIGPKNAPYMMLNTGVAN